MQNKINIKNRIAKLKALQKINATHLDVMWKGKVLPVKERLSLLFGVLSAFLQGFSLNPQDIEPVRNACSGGFPFTWIDLYYSLDKEFGLSMLTDINTSYRISVLPLIIDTVIFYVVISLAVKLKSWVAEGS